MCAIKTLLETRFCLYELYWKACFLKRRLFLHYVWNIWIFEKKKKKSWGQVTLDRQQVHSLSPVSIYPAYRVRKMIFYDVNVPLPKALLVVFRSWDLFFFPSVPNWKHIFFFLFLSNLLRRRETDRQEGREGWSVKERAWDWHPGTQRHIVFLTN